MSKWSVNQLYQKPSGFNISDYCFRLSMKTGIIAAGSVGAGGVLFAARPSIVRDSTAFIERIRLQYTTITAFTVPVTAGRSLAIAGGNNLNATGGTLLGEPVNKGFSPASSVFDAGVVRIADVGPLGGATPNTGQILAELSLAGYGAAGATVDKEFLFTGDTTAPVGLCTEDTLRTTLTDLVIYSPAGFDAGGTFELIVEIDVNELP